MSMFGPDFEEYLRTPEKRNLPDSLLSQYVGDVWSPPSAGVTVTYTSAMSLGTWFGAVNLISGSVSRPRLRPFTLDEHDTRRYQDQHRTSKLLNAAPNPYMNSLVFRRVLTAHVLVYGNGYAEIEWDNAGRAIALWPLSPTDIAPTMQGSELVYLYKGTDTGLRAPDVLHLHGLGFDGLKGYSVLAFARQSLSLGLAAQSFGATFFANGAFPGIVASTEHSLEQPARDRIRESWNQYYKGPDKSHRLAVLEGGLKVEKLTIPPDDAQFLETRQFQTGEICQFFNLNPAMLGYDAGKAPGGNYETQKISYVSDTVSPWWRIWEQEIERKLLGPGPLLIEHDAEELLQYLTVNEARLKNKADAASILIAAGFDPADVTDVCGLPPMRFEKPAPPARPQPPQKPKEDEEEPPESAPRSGSGWRRVIVDVVSRLTKLEAERVMRAARQGPERFGPWVADFYATHEIRLREALQPVLSGYSEESGSTATATALAATIVARAQEELLSARASLLEADVEALMARWERDRPGDVADELLRELPPVNRAPAARVVESVVINIPEAPPPIVSVAPQIVVPPAQSPEVRVEGAHVNVSPPGPRRKTVTFTRGRDGRIEGATVEEV